MQHDQHQLNRDLKGTVECMQTKHDFKHGKQSRTGDATVYHLQTFLLSFQLKIHVQL